MNKKLLCIFMLLCAFLAGCTGSAEPTTEPTVDTTAPSEPDPMAVYDDAIKKLQQTDSLELDISAKKSITIGTDTYHESAIQTLIYENAGSDNFVASSTEILSFDGYSILIQECYTDGTVYYTVDGNNFKGTMDADNFLSRFAPVVLIDPALYEDVEIKATNMGDNFVFTGATAPEEWLRLEGVELVDAGGESILSHDGALLSSTYHITYTYGGATITQSFTAAPDESPVEQVHLPVYPEDYLNLSNPELPRLLEQACGYLSQSGQVSTSTSKAYYSQAAGAYRSDLQQLHIVGKDDALQSKNDTNITVIDYSRGNETTNLNQSEIYQKGNYRLEENGKSVMETADLPSKEMRNYLENQLVEHITPPQFLLDGTITDLGSTYLLEFTCSEDMGKLLQDITCTSLLNDSELLNSMAESYETIELTGYLAVDKFTGLPTAAGYSYAGSHTIEEHSYSLTCQVDQSIQLGSSTALEEITGNPPEIPAGTAQPTPLFYHVTGDNGEEMWLLGTIHVGDIRTSNLPDVIYDALNASDALAVEFDTQAFETQAQHDEAIQKLLAESYFYTDGSTLADHIDPELYDYVIALMKASGNYNQNIPYCKPFALQSAITNFYLSQAHLLTPENGVDNRLLSYAKDADKKIMDVESGAFQVGMLIGFSEELQELLLVSAAAGDATEYWQSSCQLYEMWCKGDLDGIRAALETDTSQMTEEELALYNEYNDALATDRNEKMLEVAITYLQSEETVFYAVGLAHLIGEGGLVDTLAQAGYRVELVVYE